jgi:hypothetical protein
MVLLSRLPQAAHPLARTRDRENPEARRFAALAFRVHSFTHKLHDWLWNCGKLFFLQIARNAGFTALAPASVDVMVGLAPSTERE